MPSIIVTDREGDQRMITGDDRQTLMEALRLSGFDELAAMCGGNASCATCHVYVTSHQDLLPAIGADEDDLLESSDDRRADSRLSCQITLSPALEGLRVTIAPED